jgi:hypothetical protein
MRISPLLNLFAVLTAVSCRHPKEFKNTPNNAPHATLRGTTYSNAGHVFATHINGRPTSFRRSSDVFRIPQGTNGVRAAYSDRLETVGYRTGKFVASAGCNYALTRNREPALASPLTATPHSTTSNAWVIFDRRDQVVIRQRNASGPDHRILELPKEDYLFGISSSDEAIAEYRRKNP